jgi:hypothetical protein
MPKYTRNTGKAWTQDDENQLKKLAKQDTPTPVIGVVLPTNLDSQGLVF